MDQLVPNHRHGGLTPTGAPANQPRTLADRTNRLASVMFQKKNPDTGRTGLRGTVLPRSNKSAPV
jgi:hypothetical protein